MLMLGGYPMYGIFTTIARFMPVPLSAKARAGWVKSAGRIGLMTGVFAASGFLHHFYMYPNGPVINLTTGEMIQPTSTTGAPVWIFFLGQVPLFALERAFKSITGRNVGGTYGRIWTWLCVACGWQYPCTSFCPNTLDFDNSQLRSLISIESFSN